MTVKSAVVVAKPERVRRTSRGKSILIPLGSLGLLILLAVLWQLLSTVLFVVPSVPDTLSAIVDGLGDADYLDELGYTITNIGISFVIGVVSGTVLGIALGYMSRVRRAIEPFLISLYSVPKIILYPLILPILKIGAESQIAMGVVHAFFPMVIMTAGAVASMNPVYRKLGRSLDASHWQTFYRITLPAIRRPFVTGTRLGVSLATIGIILAEFFATTHGIGRVMKQAYEFGHYDKLMATVLVLLTLSFVASFILWSVERRLPE